MSITTDLHARLRAALPEAVPVLTPEEAETPNRGAGKGQTPGIPGYLQREAPQGYVQIEEPFPIRDGVITNYWIAIAAVASTREAADALAALVRLTLVGVPGRDPGHYQPQQAPSAAVIAPHAWLARQTVQAALIGGQLM